MGADAESCCADHAKGDGFELPMSNQVYSLSAPWGESCNELDGVVDRVMRAVFKCRAEDVTS
jgi:hypothetical protein